MAGLNRDQVVEILRLVRCKEKGVHIGCVHLAYSEPVQRFKKRNDVRFWSSGDSTSKRVLDILKSFYRDCEDYSTVSCSSQV